MALDRLYKVSEVKDALGICEKTIYKEIQAGRLAAEYVGRRRQVRLSESAVRAYLALNKVEATEATGAEGEATGATPIPSEEAIPSKEEQPPKARKPRAAKRAGRPRKGVAV